MAWLATTGLSEIDIERGFEHRAHHGARRARQAVPCPESFLGVRRQAEPAPTDAPPTIVPTPRLAPVDANRR